MTTGKTHRLFFQFITVFAISLIMILFTEAILWFMAPQPLNMAIRVNMEQDLPGLSPSVTYERNELGLRSLSLNTPEKPAGTFRILCLGASTTDQPTQNTADTWSGQLETIMNERFASKNLRVEVGAYGRGGDKILHRFIWAIQNIRVLKPDLVILLEGINDMCFNGGQTYVYPGFQKQLNIYANRSDKWDNFFMENYMGQDQTALLALRRYSQIARRFVNLRRNLQLRSARQSGLVKEWHSAAMPTLRKEYLAYPFRETPVRLMDPLREFGDGMAAMTGALKVDEIPVIVMSQPALWKPEMPPEEMARLWFWVETREGRVRASTAWLSGELARYNETQKQIAEHFGARFIDLAEQVPRNLDMFFDDCHFTDAGSRYAAEAIAPVVEEMILETLQEHNN